MQPFLAGVSEFRTLIVSEVLKMELPKSDNLRSRKTLTWLLNSIIPIVVLGWIPLGKGQTTSAICNNPDFLWVRPCMFSKHSYSFHR